MKKRRKLSAHTVKRAKAKKRKDPKAMLVYIAVLLLIAGIGTLKLPARSWDNADPGTIKDITRGEPTEETLEAKALTYDDIPEYSGSPYVEINGNIPTFTEEEKSVLSIAGYEYYSALDAEGRCGYCEACVGQETMPEDDREDIWMVHPSGWRSGQGWERCHIIGFQLTGENANDHNLITGTHYFNVDGMLPFENEVASAAWKGKHVMYKVVPIYKGLELIPRGVHMMAEAVEDDSVSFNVFVYNVEPGKTIDYISGFIK